MQNNRPSAAPLRHGGEAAQPVLVTLAARLLAAFGAQGFEAHIDWDSAAVAVAVEFEGGTLHVMGARVAGDGVDHEATDLDHRGLIAWVDSPEASGPCIVYDTQDGGLNVEDDIAGLILAFRVVVFRQRLADRTE
ncbi:hypothetical protein ACODT4_44575 [Streptomyces sp. 2.9]|uniref:hypothetical protein n=1 Tax=Streptomyces tritrimontium TaxID=3406573 RepID=UPI003BB61DE3